MVGAMRERVEACIEIIRPALQADQGDIELIDVDEATGVVTVRLVRDRVDGVTEVIDLASAEAAIDAPF